MVKMLIRYVSEVPDAEFEKWCKVNMIGKRDGTKILKEAAIGAGEKEIDYLVNDSITG